MSELTIVRSGIPRVDRCPVLTRVKAYVGQQGVRSTVEHQFVDRQGNPIDLEDVLPGVDGTLSVSESETEEVTPTGDVVVRVRLAGVASTPSSGEPLYEMACTIHDVTTGLVRAVLDDDLVQKAGLYEMSWAIRASDETPLFVNRALLSIEHTLYADDPFVDQKTKGPPTIQEIRMYMRDSHAHENLLLDDVEFGDEEILDAILTPINIWNESLPPLRKKMTVTNFPYREQWKQAIAGRLFISAAHGYRRNQLAYQAGGVSVADQAKEKEYLQMGMTLLEQYKEWVVGRKMAINVGRVWGHHGSQYS